MSNIHLDGIDLAKRVFHAHAVDENGGTIYRKKLSRAQSDRFIREIPTTIVMMVTCGSAHHWGRIAQSTGHEVRLIPSLYVKPFVQRHKTDFIDGATIAEAATRPRMRFFAVKSEDQQCRPAHSQTR